MVAPKAAAESIVIKNAQGIQIICTVENVPLNRQLDLTREGAEVILQVKIRANVGKPPNNGKAMDLLEGESGRQVSRVPVKDSIMEKLERRLSERLKAVVPVKVRKDLSEGARFAYNMAGIESFDVTANGIDAKPERFAATTKEILKEIAKEIAPPTPRGAEQVN